MRIQKIIIVFILILYGYALHAQENKTPISMVFVKKESKQSADELYFNVLKIENKSSEPKQLSIRLLLPEKFKIAMPLLKVYTIPAEGSQSIVVRIKIDKSAPGGKPVEIKAIASISSTEDTIEAQTFVSLPEQKRWELETEKQVYYSTGELTTIKVPLKITNKGNLTAALNLKATTLNDELQIINSSIPPVISIRSFQDTIIPITIKVKASYKNKNFSNASVTFSASDGKQVKSTQVRIDRLLNSYDYFTDSHNRTDNYVGVALQTGNYLPTPLIRSFGSGIISTKDSSEIRYNFNISKYNQLATQNYDNTFNISYKHKDLTVGFGTVGSPLAEDLSINKGVFVDYKLKLNNSNKIYTFLSKGLFSNSEGIAAGYEHISRTFQSINSMGYSQDATFNRSTISAITRTRLYLGKQQSLNFDASYFKRITDAGKRFDEKDYKQDFQYKGEYSDRLQIELNNNLELNTLEGKKRQQMFNTITANYRLSDSGYGLTALASNSFSKNELTASIDSTFKSNNYSDNYQLQLSFPRTGRYTFDIGGMSVFNAYQMNPGIVKNDAESLFLNMYRSGAHSRLNTYLLYGLRSISQAGKSIGSNNQYEVRANYSLSTGIDGDFYFTGDFQHGMFNYASINDPKEQKINVSSGINQYILNNRLKLALESNYEHLTSTAQNTLNVRSELNYLFRHGITLGISSRYDLLGLGNRRPGLSSAEFQLVKDLNPQKLKRSNYDLTLVFFKDLNGDEKMEKDEPGIDNIQVSLGQVENENIKQTFSSKAFITTSLVTNKTGEVTYKYLPVGEYQISIIALTDMQGYYNFEATKQKINIKETKKIFIPFYKVGRITGSIDVNRSEYSNLGALDLTNIRVTATDELGREFFALTDRMGMYTIYVPQDRIYSVKINNVLGGGQLDLKENNIKANLNKTDKTEINFNYQERKRRINITGKISK